MSEFEPILLTRREDGSPQNIEAYRAEGGYSAIATILRERELSANDVIQEVDDARLLGRGGAAFPVARKWRIAAGNVSKEKYVIANGGEHEPGSSKDKFLVEFYPHKIIEGILLCAYATGASKGYLYLIEDMTGPLASARRAIDEAKDAGLIGENILGSSFSFALEIHLAPTTYVAGEESAAIDSIEGGPAKPRSKPPYPGEHGLFGKPTTVNNVETLAHVPAIVRNGAQWYRGIGSEGSKGSMLFTLGEEMKHPAVFEVPFGTSWRYLLEDLGGGTKSGRPIRAIQPAMSCAFVAARDLASPISHESLRKLGSSLGCGGVRVIEEGSDVVERVAEIAAFFMAEQCGQCPACKMVTSQFNMVLQGVLAGKKGDFLGMIEKIAGFGKGRGRCSLIAMASSPILSAVKMFQQDFEAK